MIEVAADDTDELESARKRLKLAQTVADHTSAMLAYWDSTEHCRYANRAYEVWFGVSPEQLIGRTLEQLLGPIYPRNKPYIDGVLRGEPQTFEREIPDPKGGPSRHSQAEYVPHVVDGKVRGFFVLAVEVTARKRAEEAAREAAAELATALDDAPTGTALVTLDGRWIRVNHALTGLLGVSADELLGQPLVDRVNTGHRQLVCDVAQEAIDGSAARRSFEVKMSRRAGPEVDVLLSQSLVRGENGQPKHFIVQVEDLTDRKRLNEQLVITDRLAALATMSAGVAHEVNNPLAYVLANLQFAQHELERVAPLLPQGRAVALREELNLAVEGAERIGSIIRGLQAFSGSSSERLGPVDLVTAISNALVLTAHETRLRAIVREELAPVPLVMGDNARLAQVFVNLILNGIEAIPEHEPHRHELSVRTFVNERGHVIGEVRDTGTGIAPDVIGRVFDPFFTTGRPSRGLGLGLSTARGLIASFGGVIQVQSELGHGTRVWVELPPAVSVPVPLAQPEPQPAATPRRLRVLIVDDEPLVCRAMARALGAEHDVTVTTSPVEALQLSLQQPYDVFISDLMMPRLTGMDLHAALLRDRPELAKKMIFVTGGAFTPEGRAFLASNPNPKLEKPLRIEALLAAVRQAGRRNA